MDKLLISACLIGDKTRYDKKGCYTPLVKKLLERFELVPFCPEVEGGLKTPRLRSERRRNEVFNEKMINVTDKFDLGASKALDLCRYLNIKVAILKEDSPSCGVHQIYNGYFQNRKVPGMGWTTELLKKNNIKVYSENEIEDFLKELDDIEAQREVEKQERIKAKEEKIKRFNEIKNA